MVTTQNLIQAYRQVPWRSQVQWLALFLLGLIATASVISLYLNVSAQATAAGIEIRNMIKEKETLMLQNATLRNQLASMTTATEMERRALKLGYTPVDPAKARYMVVPGYIERQTPLLSSRNPKDLFTQPMIKPAYTQSLWEWLYEGALLLGQYSGSFK
jgi:hypothetical protein